MTARRRPLPRPPWCGECDEDTRCVDTEHGVRRCPVCHAATQPGGRHDPSMAAARRFRLELARNGDRSETCPACGQPIGTRHTCRASALGRSPA